MYLFYYFLLSLLLTGCTTVGSIERRYRAINDTDGIDKREARIIAQREYLKTNSHDNYRVSSAKVYGPEEVLSLDADKAGFVNHADIYDDFRKKLKYEQSWYVVFRPGFLSLFSNYYLTVVDKEDGRIQYTHDANDFAAIGQVMFTYIKPKWVSSILIGQYYRDKNEVPNDINELRHYLSEKSEGAFDCDAALKDYTIERISAASARVTYVPEGEMQKIYDIASEDTTHSQPKAEYVLEVSSAGDKTILKIHGVVDMTLTLSDSEIEGAPPCMGPDVEDILELIFD